MSFELRLAWRSLARGRGLTAVMIVALSLGIGTWYAQRQIFVFLDGKTPAAPAGLYLVGLERGEASADPTVSPVEPLMPAVLLTPRDAQAVLARASGRRTMTFGARALLEPEGAPAEAVRVRHATRALFELFAIPLAAGAPWSPVADDRAGDEALIDEDLARRLYGGASAAIGQRLRVDGAEVRVVGVVAARLHARFHLYERFIDERDAIYLPLARAADAEPDFEHAVAGGETGSAMVWVELPDPPARAAFTRGVEAYLAAERAARRGAPRAVTLVPAARWRDTFAPGGTIRLWPLLSGMCLVTSIVSLVRMLMAKFTGRAHGLGLQRAFGARRASVMGQLLLEAVLVGLIAGVGGVAIGVALMPLAAGTVSVWSGSVTIVSVGAALVTVGASVAAAVLAALYPAWRLARGTPAAQLGGGA